MNKCLWFLMIQGLLGAFDTIYYHEWRAALPALGSLTAMGPGSMKGERKLYEEVPILRRDGPSENHVKREKAFPVTKIT